MVTIASTGNATDFADSACKKVKEHHVHATREVIAAGVNAGVTLNVIDYVTMSSSGKWIRFW